MKFATVRKYAMSLPEVTEEPHHHFGSFRVKGKIFVTVPPEEEHIHVFVPEQERELAMAMYSEFIEKLLWGGKVVGVRVCLGGADATAVNNLVRRAWEYKSPKALLALQHEAGAQGDKPRKSERAAYLKRWASQLLTLE